MKTSLKIVCSALTGFRNAVDPFGEKTISSFDATLRAVSALGGVLATSTESHNPSKMVTEFVNVFNSEGEVDRKAALNTEALNSLQELSTDEESACMCLLHCGHNGNIAFLRFLLKIHQEKSLPLSRAILVFTSTVSPDDTILTEFMQALESLPEGKPAITWQLSCGKIFEEGLAQSAWRDDENIDFLANHFGLLAISLGLAVVSRQGSESLIAGEDRQLSPPHALKERILAEVERLNVEHS